MINTKEEPAPASSSWDWEQPLLLNSAHPWTQTDTEIVVIDQDRFYAMDGVGFAIWGSLAAGKTPLQIFEELESIYDAEPQTLKNDLIQFLNDLAHRGWVIAPGI